MGQGKFLGEERDQASPVTVKFLALEPLDEAVELAIFPKLWWFSGMEPCSLCLMCIWAFNSQSNLIGTVTVSSSHMKTWKYRQAK